MSLSSRRLTARLTREGAIGYAALAAIVVVGAVLRFSAIGAKSIWLDEAFSIWVARRSLPELLQFVGSVDHHPPLYYLLLHYWQTAFGDGQGTVRLLSALLGVATIPVFYWGGRLFVGRRSSLIAALLLAISPFHVRYGQEARMYALMTILAAGMLWCLAVYLTDSQARGVRRRIAMFGLGAAQAALMLSHNTAAFLVPAALNLGVLGPYLWNRGRGVIALPALNEDHFLRGWLAIQLAAFAVWALWLPNFFGQVSTVYQNFWIERPTGYFIWLTFHNFNLAYPDGWFPGSPWWDFLYWGLALAGLLALRKRGAVAVLLASLFIVPPALELAISIRRPIFYDRTLIWTTLPYYLLIGAGLNWAAGSARRRLGGETASADENGCRRKLRVTIAGALLLTLVILSAFSLRSYYGGFMKEDWSAAAAYVADNARPDDLILFNAPWGEIPFAYYAKQETVTAEMRGVPTDLFNRGELESVMTEADLTYLSDLIAAHDEVWLVYTHEWYTDPAGLLPERLASAYDLLDEQEFNGPRVLHFRRSAAGRD